MVGTWVTLELEKAVEKGYVIIEKYWAWHFLPTTQYDPVTKMGGLWAKCINLRLTRKHQEDGYPSWCHRQQYINDYYDLEAIQLNPKMIDRNEGFQSLCKIMLNSDCGRF